MSHLNKALEKKMGKEKKPYGFASQAILDTPRPRTVRIEKSKAKPGYKIPKEPSNGIKVGP